VTLDPEQARFEEPLEPGPDTLGQDLNKKRPETTIEAQVAAGADRSALREVD
jgi:hypothetical protein